MVVPPQKQKSEDWRRRCISHRLAIGPFVIRNGHGLCTGGRLVPHLRCPHDGMDRPALQVGVPKMQITF
jgi:hypothetical protein